MILSNYKIEFEDGLEVNNLQIPYIAGAISAEDVSEIIRIKNINYRKFIGELDYIKGILVFMFNKELSKCTNIILVPTYHDKENDEDYIFDYIHVDVSDIFKIE